MPFSLSDYSDRELLFIVTDHASDDGGWVVSQEIAKAVGSDVHCVSSRFAWMRRYGIMERTSETPTRWRLTREGKAVRDASAASDGAVAKALRRLKQSEILWASHVLAGKFQEADAPYATLTRREWQREIRRRKA